MDVMVRFRAIAVVLALMVVIAEGRHYRSQLPADKSAALAIVAHNLS